MRNIRAGGAAWVCMMGDDGKPLPCGASSFPTKPVRDAWSVSTAPTDGHDGHYVVGPTTASPPAIAN